MKYCSRHEEALKTRKITKENGVEKMRTVLTRAAQRDEKKVFNITAAQRYLGVKRKVFLLILESGELPYRQLGRSKIFTRDTLDRWLRFEPLDDARK